MLEARWRLANELTDHGKRQLLNLKELLLDAKVPLLLTTEEMEHLGGPVEGYEQVRTPMPSTADFKHRLNLNSAEHQAWLEAVGTV